jgi:hypothetical protein
MPSPTLVFVAISEHLLYKVYFSWVQCCAPVVPAVRRLRQEDHLSLDQCWHIARPTLKNKRKNEIK